MEALVKLLVDAVSSASLLKVGLPITLIAASGAGVVPRVGPGRAVSLALLSKIRSTSPQSQRIDDVTKLRELLNPRGRDPASYIVVLGPKGVGKSCVIATATARTCGVVSVKVPPGTLEKDIVTSVLAEITRVNVFARYVNMDRSARRVLWFYKLSMLPPPIAVLCASERTENKQFAEITGAVRTLAGDYGLRVVIDSSDNSLPSDALSSIRQRTLVMSEMPKAALQAIPEFAVLHAKLKALGVDDLVYEVCGGIPAQYMALNDELRHAKPEEEAAAVKRFLLDLMQRAAERYVMASAAHPRMKPVLDLFREHCSVPLAILKDKEIVRPTPDKVLRVVGKNLVPADAPMRLVLRYGLAEAPSWEDLLKLAGHKA